MLNLYNTIKEGVYDAGIFKAIFMAGGSGSGKCMQKGTEVIMYDGSLKKVEDISINDILMGDDFTPRKVLSITSGEGQLYDIIQNGAITYTVNKEHILVLKKAAHAINSKKSRYTSYNDTLEISVKDFIKKSSRFKRNFYGYKSKCIPFKKQKLNIDPYFLGLWLGDGLSSQVAITTMDKEILDYIYNMAEKKDYRIYENKKINTKASTYYFRWDYDQNNPLLDIFKDLNLIHNKHIPKDYIINNEENRLKLLAGIIDTDGHFSNKCYYDIVMSNKKLLKQIKYLADTLGFKTNFHYKKSSINGKYFDSWRVSISGDIWRIPCKIKRKKVNENQLSKNKDWLVTGIKVKLAKFNQYFGFLLDGNNRFLLKDGTIAHNSYIAYLATAGMNLKVVNSDDLFEILLKKAGLGLDMQAMSSEDYMQSQDIRAHAKDLTSKKLDLLLRGRIGLVIDGTGRRYEKIIKMSKMLQELGYDTSMILVNTSLEVALERNAARSRKVTSDIAASIWKEVQDNIGKFQNFFGRNNFYIIDNSTYDNKDAINKTRKEITKFINTPPENPIAKQWIQNELNVKRREDYKVLKWRLNEMLDQHNISNWNNVQKNIWLRMVQEHIVAINDMKKFFEFNKVFNDYFDKFNKPVPYEYVIQII